jgi:hypothetical protein
VLQPNLQELDQIPDSKSTGETELAKELVDEEVGFGEGFWSFLGGEGGVGCEREREGGSGGKGERVGVSDDSLQERRTAMLRRLFDEGREKCRRLTLSQHEPGTALLRKRSHRLRRRFLQLDIAQFVAQQRDRSGGTGFRPCRRGEGELLQEGEEFAGNLSSAMKVSARGKAGKGKKRTWKLLSFGPGFFPTSHLTTTSASLINPSP